MSNMSEYDLNGTKYKISLNLARLRLLLNNIKTGKLPVNLKWYYLGSLNELYEITKQDVKKLNQITKEADGQ